MGGNGGAGRFPILAPNRGNPLEWRRGGEGEVVDRNANDDYDHDFDPTVLQTLAPRRKGRVGHAATAHWELSPKFCILLLIIR